MPATPELAVKFDNPFTPTPVKLKIPVEKTVKIKPDIEQPNLVFYFDLTAKDGAPMPASSSGSTVTINWPDESSGEFGEITFTETGVYQYTVAERAGTEPGVVYDTTPRTVVVTVTINENDELEAHFTVTGGGTSSTADKPVEFTNTYDNGSLRIKKTVTGNRGNKKQSFPFLVEFFDANWKEITTQSYSYTKYTSSGQEIHPGFKSGETIYLRDGEYAVFTGLPVGIRYKVTETNSHGHYASSTGETGKIVANKIATAAFKNCRSDVPKTGETDLLPVTVPIMGASGIGMILTALFGKKRKPRKDK